MEIDLDQDRCVGAGQCVLAAPDVFDQRDEDGIAVLLDAHPADHLSDGVRQAVDVCPAMAIRVRP